MTSKHSWFQIFFQPTLNVRVPRRKSKSSAIRRESPHRIRHKNGSNCNGEKLFLLRQNGFGPAWLGRKRVESEGGTVKIHCYGFRLSTNRTNVEDAATGIVRTCVAGLHPDPHGTPQFLRHRTAVRLLQASRCSGTYQGGTRQTGPFTRNRGATEDRLRSAAGRCFSRWALQSKIIFVRAQMRYGLYNTICKLIL